MAFLLRLAEIATFRFSPLVIVVVSMSISKSFSPDVCFASPFTEETSNSISSFLRRFVFFFLFNTKPASVPAGPSSGDGVIDVNTEEVFCCCVVEEDEGEMGAI